MPACLCFSFRKNGFLEAIHGVEASFSLQLHLAELSSGSGPTCLLLAFGVKVNYSHLGPPLLL